MLFAGVLALTIGLLIPTFASADIVDTLLPGTAVLLSQSGSGALSSTSTSTNTFTPGTYADYKHFGGEPTTVVDRYPCVTGHPCPPTPDNVYVCSPQGFAFPHYSTFLKSSDLGQTFRATFHITVQGQPQFTAGGGGDCHIAVGQVSHKVFFTDLPAACVTLSQSTDFGESFTSDPLGCGTTPGAIDDRNWVAVDELIHADPAQGHVYISFINFSSQIAPTLEAQVSNEDGAAGTFITDSTCNAGTLAVGAGSNGPSPCPDPADPQLAIAGPPVVDLYSSHNVYIPFIRNTPVVPGVSAGPPFSLWLAKSTDGGFSWSRVHVADLGAHDPGNIFPVMTVDKAGNLYYTWSQTMGSSEAAPALGGEQDVFYAISTNQGAAWSQPIDLTKEVGDSAVFPWMQAGDAGQVDLVFYKSNTGLNSNVAFVDQNGNPSSCTSSNGSTCFSNPSVWNVFFAQSQNALNTGPNFKTVQISSEPNHLGQICTGGLGCSTGGDRNLLDFFTVDVDHLGAANVTFADDYNGPTIDFNRFTRQVAGNSVFKNTNVSLASSWPITNHAVTDVAGDTFDASGVSKGSCSGMDLLGTSEQASNGMLTVTLTLNNAPTSTEAIGCGDVGATGGLWGAEFWASSTEGGNNYYLAYRDNPPNGSPRVEAGAYDHLNTLVTSPDFGPRQGGTLGGTCFSGGTPTSVSPCTLILTTSLSTLGIKAGAGLYSITGLSVYLLGGPNVPFSNLNLANNEFADAATAFDDNGTGTTTK
ncbi:MAG TPA: sialidase family protein [Candidatus Dormibacteraeota bacterium]